MVVGFEYESDARRFREALAERFSKFALELHPDKTRLIEFGPLAASNRKRRGQGKPETFVRGHVRYYGVPMNSQAIALVRYRVGWLWYRSLRRRSQKSRLTWERMRWLIDRWLPPARVCHPYPPRRLGVIT